MRPFRFQLWLTAALAAVLPSAASASLDAWSQGWPEAPQVHQQAEASEPVETSSEEAAEASEWGSWGLKTASGDFFEDPPESAGKSWPQTQQPRRENGDCDYDTASDVRNGPNVYTYVVQNPWTKFDPLGLKFDEDTFDYNSEEFDKGDYSSGRAKSWDDLDEDTQNWARKQDWFEGSEQWNSDVERFNKKWQEVAGTPFGSAMIDKLHSSKNVYRFSFGAESENGAPAYFSPQGGGRGWSRIHFSSDGLTRFTVGHELFHGVQHHYDPNDTDRGSREDSVGNEFFRSGTYYSNDPKYDIKEGKGHTPAWKEFQANRAGNIVETEYQIMNEPAATVSGPGLSPTVDSYSVSPIKSQNGIIYMPGIYDRGRTTYNNIPHPHAVMPSYDFGPALDQRFSKN